MQCTERSRDRQRPEFLERYPVQDAARTTIQRANADRRQTSLQTKVEALSYSEHAMLSEPNHSPSLKSQAYLGQFELFFATACESSRISRLILVCPLPLLLRRQHFLAGSSTALFFGFHARLSFGTSTIFHLLINSFAENCREARGLCTQYQRNQSITGTVSYDVGPSQSGVR